MVPTTTTSGTGDSFVVSSGMVCTTLTEGCTYSPTCSPSRGTVSDGSSPGVKFIKRPQTGDPESVWREWESEKWRGSCARREAKEREEKNRKKKKKGSSFNVFYSKRRFHR